MSLLERLHPQIFDIAPYQPGLPEAEVRRLHQLDRVDKLASNENPLGCGALVQRALSESLDSVHRYPEGDAPLLKRALAEALSVEPECIVLGNGSNEVLELAAQLWVHPGRNVVVSDHAFVVYRLAALGRGGAVRSIAARDFAHDLEAMAEAVDDQTGVVFIANPNNPTGTCAGAGAIWELLNAVPDDVLVVLDEAYSEYARALRPDYPDSLELLRSHRNLVVTRTFSKIHGLAALRVGYALCAPELAEVFNRVRQPFNVNHLAQLAAAAALADAEHQERSLRCNAEGLDQLCAGFGALGLEWIPSAGNFVTVHLGGRSGDIYQRLLQRGLAVRELGAAYQMPDHLRITVGAEGQNARLLRALESLL
ncbi:MAG: histidinol-phosphate transaminase [Gammaproteobacteria bacterium AqS3]|nr:histidinol-phosphate transaminase [Gammaproteobacteria bacterium AqS3]